MRTPPAILPSSRPLSARARSLRSGLALLAPALLLAACAESTQSGSPAAPQQAAAQAASAPPGASTPVTPPPSEPWLIENFEQANGLSGGFWYEFDKNPLGTVANPNPFQLAKGGAPGSPGTAAHIWGKLGADRAPWTWVQLQIFIDRNKSPRDLRAEQSIRFWTKGDGGRYWLSLVKASVKNYDHFHYEFTAPAEWTEIRVPLTEFRQAGWGALLPQVFDDVTTLQLSPAEHDKPFDVWIDDLALSTQAVKTEPIAYNTSDWFAWKGIDPVKRRGTALDVSRLLDAPAGKHGAVTRKGDRFVFADGKPARFWGVNIVASANFPSHAEAERTAELLAELGVNMTRHHHIDAAWSTPNVFGNKPTTQELDPEAMERFDYFIAQLQKRGIYQYFDMLVHRKVTAGDGVPDADKLGAGFKIEGEFSPELIALEEKFISEFMGHQNPYTKHSYASDPAIALVETINEDSLFYIANEGDFAVKTPHYRDELNHQFSDWLKKKVPGGRAALEKRWAPGGAGKGLLPDEDPERGNVDASSAMVGQQEQKYDAARTADTLHFLYDTELSFYQRIRAQLKKLGFRGLVTGSNHWVEHPLDLLASSELDFVDRHAYWAHPAGGWGYNSSITWNPSAMVKDPNLGVVGVIAHRRVKGLPYASSEWQIAAPNDYREEGVLLMGAYAAFQDFSPLEFAFSHDASKKSDAPSAISNNFDLIEQPAMLGAWPAVSLLFHRGDVRPSKLEADLKVELEKSYTPNATLSAPPGVAMAVRTGVDFHGGETPSELEQVIAKHSENGAIVSDTKELRHDASAGRFEVDTARSQGFAGFRPAAPVTLTNASIELKSPFAVVIVTALDDQPIATSKHLLVSALANAVNSGMSLAPSGNRLVDAGKPPILVEPVLGSVKLVKLGGSLDHVKAYALAASGERAQEVTLAHDTASLTLTLEAKNQTLHYEIERK